MNEQDNEIDSILENIADVVVEQKTRPAELGDDPFDFYVQRVQSGLFSKKDAFRERFVKGYHALMKELEDL